MATVESDWTLGVDAERPTLARVYDYLLGGTHNFGVDRDLAHGLLKVEPQARSVAAANRAFLRRAIRRLSAQGIRQFLDLGSGIPTQGNVHQIAREADEDARVVYVDIDPVAVAHSRAILGDDPNAIVIQADMRRPGEILADPAVRKTLDLSEPVGVLLLAVLHAIPEDDDPYGLVHGLRDAVAPGSAVVVSHLTNEDPYGTFEAFEQLSARSTTAAVARSRTEISRFFEGCDLSEPGVVFIHEWHPDPQDDPVDQHSTLILCGVAFKP
ncbi:SAM-dependent methyltransferase [Rhizohabitans arisaemae]|uniref:SAM-dependent methyltransferase n=1 Tax=Rhizohabitans arisaemae TaxID=2720610 RepID=UPI0024B1EBCF|nr:SAM-dependent methyltransferase [Rhizohabitans arisaemae]